MARILLIDDDPALLEVVSLAVTDAGHAVTTAEDGERGWTLLQSSRPNLVVSDINMPRLDGFALLRKLRGAGDALPLILLTSRDSEIDEALGLELGADDYVSKPFSARVLVARIAALLRREELREKGAAGTRKTIGRLALDAERLEVSYAGMRIEITVTEFKLLDALTQRPGIVLSRERLLQLTRDDDSIVADRIIDTYVRRLRRKLEAVDPSFCEIETVTGAGYRWRAPEV
jgi:DNA-binding response OmpR family regulator